MFKSSRSSRWSIDPPHFDLSHYLPGFAEMPRPGVSRRDSTLAMPRRGRAFKRLSRQSSRQSSLTRTSRPTSRQGRLNDIQARIRRSSSADSFLSIRSIQDLEPKPCSFTRAGKIKRWDGNKRSTTDWDSIRRDTELCFPDGDCLVHFYAQGRSRRGPSLRLNLLDIEASNCMPMLEQCLARPVPDIPATFLYSDSETEYGRPARRQHELFIPAPAHLSREDAFNYHLTTRNFFAWMFERPLVGPRLGDALIDLKERMDQYRPDREENEDDFLIYIDAQGYSDFRDCPDHSLAVLQYAEKFHYAELWTDAFCHCAGMNELLISSSEFSGVSRTTKAIITRANLEMQLRLEKASVSLANFMEDGLSTSQISLPTPALRHLERFRSFLHSFYVQRHGYWPPHIIQPNRGKSNPLPKHTLLTMYTDFRNLYEFIADTSTTPDTKLGDSVCGGSFSIIDYIISFSRRHKYSYLPFSLPHQPNVVPQFPAQPNLGTGRGMSLFSRLIGSKRDTIGRRMGLLAALQSATNVGDSKVMNSALVHEYARFEREYTLHEDDRLSHIDARNIRWLNIYSILQTLISVTQVPTEVIDIEGVDYPLCCQTAGTPPWKFNMLASEASSSTNVSSPTMASTVSDSSIETPPSRVSPSAQVPPLNLAAVASRRLSTLSTATKVAADQEAIFPHLVPLPITPSQNSTPEQHSDSATPRPLKTKSKSATPPPTIRTPSLARRLVNRSVPLSCPQPRRPVAEILINNYDPHDTSVVPAILAEHELEADHSGDSDAGSIYSNDGNTTETIHNPPSSSSTPTSSQHSPPSLQSSFDDSEPETPMTANFSTKSGAPYSTAATDSSPRIWDEANLLEEHRLSLPPMPTGDEDSKDRHDSTIGVISVTPGPLYMHGKPRKMQRKKSSELAQKFRQGIKWKEGPGWSWEADVLLRGAT